MGEPARKVDETAMESDDGLTIDIVSTHSSTDMAMEKLMSNNPGPCKVFGLDCEWNINHTKGAIVKPDLLQIATCNGYCVLFRLSRLNSVPPQLKSFLENPHYTKVGVAVLEDAMKLQESFGVTTKGVVDVRFLADEEGFDPRGLSTLTESVLGDTCVKHHWKFHHWTGHLTEEHKRYAAIDAVFGARIFNELNHRRLSRHWSKELKTWSDHEYNVRTYSLWEKYFNKPFCYNNCKYVIGKLVKDMIRLSDLSWEKTSESLQKQKLV